MQTETSNQQEVFETKFEKGDLRIEALAGASRRLVVSFTSLALKPGVWPRKEFVKIARMGGENHMICVTDRSCSWFNGGGIAERVTEVVASYVKAHGIEDVTAIGTSMGGYSALQFSRLYPIRATLAFAPQFSPDPALVPKEERWMEYRGKIRQWPFRSVEGLPEKNTDFFIVHGETDDERYHWERFPEGKNMTHFILGNVGHKMDTLRNGGRLKRLVSAVINNDIEMFHRVARRAGGSLRDEYERQDERAY